LVAEPLLELLSVGHVLRFGLSLLGVGFVGHSPDIRSHLGVLLPQGFIFFVDLPLFSAERCHQVDMVLANLAVEVLLLLDLLHQDLDVFSLS
jgi:hypothetical protein